MKTIAALILILASSCAAVGAEAANWRDIWDGPKTDWWDKSIPELRKLVQQKDPLATLILADKLYYEDREEAEKLRQQAVDYGVPQAMVWLAEQPETPRSQWLDLVTRAAATGYPKAQVSLAGHFGRKGDYEKALSLIRAAADQGYAEAMRELAELYSAGIGEPRSDAEKPVSLLRTAARKGDRYAGKDLEKRLRLGIGTEIDLLEAAYFYYRTKQEGNPQQVAMSRRLDLQKDPNRDTMTLLDRLFEEGFAGGNKASLLELAKFHEAGTHGKTNLARACAILTLAGSPEAAAKANGLTEEARKAMERDLGWMQARGRNQLR